MQKIISAALAILVGGAVGQSLLAWWSLPVLAALIALIFRMRPRPALIGGFLGGLLLWGGYAAILNVQNDGILSARIGALFGGVSGILLVFITGFFGAVFAALGAWTGSLVREKE
ncbi:MAG: hypothetical protein RIC19_09115 [Phaeodactylibacter sp.]|uniref:hypothetical protein n=1 Tax=Phaeodactylibacter sp. TaxID=1940289 RepID=UPI0032EFF84D